MYIKSLKSVLKHSILFLFENPLEHLLISSLYNVDNNRSLVDNKCSDILTIV